jgi:nucleotide-binding universal stress UspA family protein
VFKHVLVGVDGSATAHAALAHAIELAKSYSAALHIVCAYRGAADLAALAVDPVGASIGASAASVEQDLHAEADSILSDAARDAKDAGVDVETLAVAGDASEAILDTAERLDADLIVVGNRGMGGARRYLLGSVPDRVSHHAACSVMIVHTT